MVDRYNCLWICNEGNTSGIDRYDINTKSFKSYSHDSKDTNTLSSNNILCTLEDDAGIVWLIDTTSSTVNKCVRENNVFKNYFHDSTDPSSISSIDILSLCEDKMKNIWIATFKGGLCWYKQDGKFESFEHSANDPTALPINSIDSILDTANNKLWLGLEEGSIGLFDTSTKKIIKNIQTPDYTTPCYLTQDNRNPDLIWFGCFYKGGLFSFNSATGKFTKYKNTSSNVNTASFKSTTHILQDGDYLWIGTGGDGLCKFHKPTGKYVYYKHNPNDKNSISGNVVIETFIDSKGRYWVTTDDEGLNKFDELTGIFTHYSVECGFPSKSSRHILEDKHGYLWISTDFCIVKFDPNTSKVVRRFTPVDGLASGHFDKLTNPLKDSNGIFWFSTLKGLCSFNPEETNKIQSNSHAPPIVLSSFKTKEGTYNETGFRKLSEVNLPCTDNSFEFTFSALDYTNPGKNQSSYKLEGFDNDWNYIGINHLGKYTNLPPGNYILKLKGSNNDGVWNENGISIKVTITPSFWMTSWFKVLIGIALLCSVASIFLLRIRILKKKALYMKNLALAEATAQVAHDIRSPLAALSTALKDLQELPEQKRILIRNATRRISDIANNLLFKYKIGENKDNPKMSETINLKAELVSSLLDSLISEKRVQITDKSIEIVLDLGHNTYNCFVNLDSEKFKRMISNLINNAIDAIDTKGNINVTLTKEGYYLAIRIIDNGKGIPENVLPKIKQGAISFGKKEGCGLGISNAIQNIKNWNGSYDIQSEENLGTTFIVRLPIAEEPDWFQSNILISNNRHIIVLDDDESIHNIWQTHFAEYVDKNIIKLHHFYDPIPFVTYSRTSRSKDDLFLIDYELANSKDSGLDLIEKLGLKNQAVLVTSRYEEPDIRERINKLGLKIIPKNFAPYIPISMMNNATENDMLELIFIDDDKTLTTAWKMQASIVKKNIATFNHLEDFKNVMYRFNKDVAIYIDSDLKEEISGEMFAKFLYEQGFHNLYLATGYEKDKFGPLPWIKEIVSKEAPF